FYYCSTENEIFRLFIYLHSILISFSLGFLFLPKVKKNIEKINYISKGKILILFVLGFLSIVYLIFDNFGKILLVLNSGYLALYDGQSED
ncbi:O-antigen polysaccharide polymerase Wzy, partial [Acinetobacter baumannii]|nr:O-antigen polysaccharide polymerase Wzy [Acinetobacter baumannii]